MAEIRVLHGAPLRVIAEESQRSDLLVLGASTDRRLRDLVVGSTAQRLLGKTRAPILVARNRPGADYRRVLVALDFSALDDTAVAYARAVAPHARLDLMHVFDTSFEGKMRYAGVGSDAISEYRFTAREAAMREMALAARRVPEHSRAVVVNGPVASNVLRQGRRSDADLIVVAHPKRAWLWNLVMQPVAAQVLSEAQSDVLVVH
jgi:nucleotide-binding universal stress UspA family protein